MLSDLRCRLRAIFNRKTVESELDEELRFHIERQISKLIMAGLTEQEAARRVWLEFGGHDQVSEACREARGVSGLENLWRDTVHAARVLRKTPGYTFPVLLILIAGIGFSSALFSVLYDLLARPLPYAQADRLVSVEQSIYFGKTPYIGVSLPEAARWRRSGAFSRMSVFSWRKFAVTGTDEPIPAVGLAVDPEFFQTLGARPFLGRVLNSVSEQAGPQIVIVSFSFWVSHLGRDPKAIGRTIEFDAHPFTVAGVMPPEFRFPLVEPLPGFAASFWIPLNLPAGSHYDENDRDFEVVAHLAGGVTPSRARSRLLASSGNGRGHRTITVSPLRESITKDVKPAVPILVVADGFVLLILLANVASLTLARAIGRSREIAIRLALGASRCRVFQQLAVENYLLGGIACAGGLVVSFGFIRFVSLFAPGALPAMVQPELSVPVLAFTSILAIFLMSMAAIGPVLRISDGASKMWTGSRRGRPRRPFQHSLISVQIALSLVLSIAAGLLFRSLDRLQSVDVGFYDSDVLTARLSLSPARYRSAEQARQFHRAVLENVQALPGVRSAALTMTLPFSGRSNMMPIVMDAERSIGTRGRLQVERNIVTEDYFRTMGTRLLAGRDFSSQDRAGAPLVAIVNRKMADLWPGGHALGRQFRFAVSGNATPSIRIIGVVANEKHWNVTDAPEPEAYFAFDQSDAGSGGSFLLRILTFLVVKGFGEPAALSQAVKQAVWRVDPREPVEQITPLAELVKRSLAAPRFRALLLVAYALLAAAIALFGIYSVVAFLVGEREYEFGVRLALGATRYRLLRFALLSCVAKPVLFGMALGLLGSTVASRTVRAFLYGIRPFDSATYALATVSLLWLVCLAGYLPARRVLSIDPNEVLRQD